MIDAPRTCPDCAASFEPTDNYCRQCGMFLSALRDTAMIAAAAADGRIDQAEQAYKLMMEGTEPYLGILLEYAGNAAPVAQPLQVELAPAEARWVTLGVQLPPEAARTVGAGAHGIRFHIDREASPGDPSSAASVVEKSTFMVPR